MLKYVNIFGTSFSNGGGLEFHKKSYLKEIYSPLNIPLEKNLFKPAGILQKKLPGIQVINYAKDGFGNERIYRKIFDIISNEDFKPEEHLFVIEFSDLGRKEVYSPKDKKHGIINYNFDKKGITENGHSFDYDFGFTHPQSSENLYKITKKWIDFKNSEYDFQNELQKVYVSIIGIISYLSVMKTNFIISHPSDVITTYTNHFFKKFYYNILNIENKNLFIWLRDKNYCLIDETKGKVNDRHFGYGANKIIAATIFNKMIQMQLIKETPIPLHYLIKDAQEIKTKINETN